MSSFKYKVVLTGEGAVGKTSLISRFLHNKFEKKYEATIGIDISSKNVEYVPNDIATISIWDVGGQQRFEFIRSSFYKGAKGALLVFDLMRNDTYIKIKKWLEDIRKMVGEKIPFILIGNKVDLIEDVGDVVDRDEAKTFAESESSIYIETSAKTGQNVEDAFKKLTHRMVISSE